MTAYYNEIDPAAAEWLRYLIKADLIAGGVVDERSIEDVFPDDLRGFTQCHFFAGIGGWSYALRLSGWPDDRPVWTGSCPCQPFSAAGKGAAFDDERHLWPAFFHLIEQRKPPVIFGEQVASKAADDWIDLVQADMEGVGYAFGCVPFPSAGIGAPHIRDRNYWVANASGAGHIPLSLPRIHCSEESAGARHGESERYGATRRLVDTESARSADGETLARSGGSLLSAASPEFGIGHRGVVSEWTGPTNGHWRAADWLLCRDGKWRPVEPGTFPLAHGVPARVVRLRGYGNAINPEQAAIFIKAAEEAMT